MQPCTWVARSVVGAYRCCMRAGTPSKSPASLPPLPLLPLQNSKVTTIHRPHRGISLDALHCLVDIPCVKYPVTFLYSLPLHFPQPQQPRFQNLDLLCFSTSLFPLFGFHIILPAHPWPLIYIASLKHTSGLVRRVRRVRLARSSSTAPLDLRVDFVIASTPILSNSTTLPATTTILQTQSRGPSIPGLGEKHSDPTLETS